MSQKPVLPTGRAAVFTAVCVGLAVAAHTWMSGSAIPPWAVLAGTAPVFLTARMTAGRERSLGTILLLMGLDQTALHLLFETAQGHVATVSPGPVAMPGMQMPGMPSTLSVPTMQLAMPVAVNHAAGGQVPGIQMAAMHMTPGMFAMHVVAALICAWWLRRGEVTLHAMAGTVAAWIADRFRLPQAGLVRVVVSGPTDRCFLAAGPIRPTTGLLRFVLARRGPPPLLSDQLRLVTP